MAVKTAAIAVSTSPTLLTASGTGVFEQAFSVFNADDDVVVYLGGPDVTAANGYPLAPGEHFGADLRNRANELYAITGAGSAVVRVLGTEQ